MCLCSDRPAGCMSGQASEKEVKKLLSELFHPSLRVPDRRGQQGADRPRAFPAHRCSSASSDPTSGERSRLDPCAFAEHIPFLPPPPSRVSLQGFPRSDDPNPAVLHAPPPTAPVVGQSLRLSHPRLLHLHRQRVERPVVVRVSLERTDCSGDPAAYRANGVTLYPNPYSHDAPPSTMQVVYDPCRLYAFVHRPCASALDAGEQCHDPARFPRQPSRRFPYLMPRRRPQLPLRMLRRPIPGIPARCGCNGSITCTAPPPSEPPFRSPEPSCPTPPTPA